MTVDCGADPSGRELERVLVRRMVSGEEVAFELFSDLYIPVMYRFVQRSLAGDPELTREIVQTTLAKVLPKLATFRGDAALTTWLCSCCRNEIAAHFRRAKRRPREVDLDSRPVADPSSTSRRHSARAAAFIAASSPGGTSGRGPAASSSRRSSSSPSSGVRVLFCSLMASPPFPGHAPRPPAPGPKRPHEKPCGPG